MELLKYFKTKAQVKTEEEIIQEIHDSFDNAQEELLSKAREIIGQVESKSKFVDKAERLKDLGFTSSKAVIRGEELKETLLKSQEDATMVEYYKYTYPFLKFLRVEQLDSICKKYGLVYATVDRYAEDVPEKNVRELEMAQPLKWTDSVENRYFLQVHDTWHNVPSDLESILTKGFYVDELCKPNDKNVLKYAKSHGGYTGDYDDYTVNIGSRAATITEEKMNGLFIAAPKNHFDLEGTKNKGLAFFDVKETKINDPIVFRFVRGGIQVLTKWGLEAEDPELQVGLMN